MTTVLPRVGVTTYREPARWGEWDVVADLLPAEYADAVQDAGAVALLLPPAPGSHAEAVLDGLHGLVVSGGPDVDPARYGAPPHPRTGAPRVQRDEWELALVHAALARDLPMLAICRGLQVLNTALGGTLVQHLPDVVGSDVHSPTLGAHGRHDVVLAGGCRLAVACGEKLVTATHHHQGLADLGAGMVACGWADDGTVEAVELPAQSWAFGVQWHPEAHEGQLLFADFVAACRTRAQGAR